MKNTASVPGVRESRGKAYLIANVAFSLEELDFFPFDVRKKEVG